MGGIYAPLNLSALYPLSRIFPVFTASRELSTPRFRTSRGFWYNQRMFKNIISLFFVFALALPAGAQTRSVVATSTRDAVQQFKQTVSSTRANFQIMMEQSRLQFQESMDAARTQLQTRLGEHRQALQTQLQKIRDERKRTSVQNIDDQMNDLNKRRLEHYTNVLDHLVTVLDRIASRADKAATRGADISAVRTAIDAARVAIDAARAAIASQTAKVYNITISDDTTLKNDVGKARRALQADLKIVHEKVKAAYEAARNAATTLAQIPRVDEATSTIPIATSSTSTVQ